MVVYIVFHVEVTGRKEFKGVFSSKEEAEKCVRWERNLACWVCRVEKVKVLEKF